MGLIGVWTGFLDGVDFVHNIPYLFLDLPFLILFIIQPHAPFFSILFLVPHIHWCLINVMRRSVDV